MDAQAYKVFMQKNCPITDIKIVAKANAHDKKYTYIDFDGKFKIGFTKSADSLPIAEYEIAQDTPCMDMYSAFSYDKSLSTNFF